MLPLAFYVDVDLRWASILYKILYLDRVLPKAGSI